MIIVTGGVGLVGSNIIKGLNDRGESDILVVDHLKNGRKMHNLADLDIKDYLDRDDFIDYVKAGKRFGPVDAVFHQGACSATTEWDGKYVMQNNFEYSKTLLHWSQTNSAQFLYASSASVYGAGKNGFVEMRSCEKPINMYAYSKFQFDQYVRRFQSELKSQVVGLRYFNVYGQGEAHKGSMASTPFHFNNQILNEGVAKLFCGVDGFLDGEQKRDFLYVGDCVDVNLWFLDHPLKSGIFNLGTGLARTFNDVVSAVLRWHSKNGQKQARVEYIPFPQHLIGSYQNYTQADITKLRETGYDKSFTSIEDGIFMYLDWLNLGDNSRRGIS